MHAPRSSVLLGMLLGAGLLGTGLLLGAAADRDAGGPAEVVQARRIEVVDELGTVRLVLGSNDEGGTISVRDRLGRTVLIAGAAANGGTMVITRTASGSPAFAAGATATGGALQVFDASGARVVDATSSATGGRLGIFTSAAPGSVTPGAAVVRLAVGDDGAGTLDTFLRSPDHPLLSLGSTREGHGEIETHAGGDQALVALTSTADGKGHVYTFDQQGRPLVALASRGEEATLRVYNTTGQPVVTLEPGDAGEGHLGLWRADGTGRALAP